MTVSDSHLPDGSWLDDGIERARYLDGEGTADERADRARDLVRNPQARAGLEADERFLAVVRTAKAALPVPSDLLEGRVRRALAADRAAGFPSSGAGDAVGSFRSSRVLAYAAAAAAIVATVSIWAFSDRATPTAEAESRNIRQAAKTYIDARAGRVPSGPTGGSCEEGASSPLRAPFVTSGENSVTACAHDADGRTVAIIRPTNDAHGEKGLVIVPRDEKATATDVGYTRVGDVVVFDVAIGRAKYYLAVPWKSVSGTPMCAACHGPATAAGKNPHEFVPRTAIVYDPR